MAENNVTPEQETQFNEACAALEKEIGVPNMCVPALSNITHQPHETTSITKYIDTCSGDGFTNGGFCFL
jgi:hypothetical protein